MSWHRYNLLAARVLLCGPFLLLGSDAFAQQHGGGNPTGGYGLSGISRPDGVDESDTLKDFHHAMAVQANSQQIAEFQIVMKSTEGAQAEVQKLHDQPPGKTEAAQRKSALEQALKNALTENRKFISGFSDSQKAGLKDISKRLEKADTNLELEVKKLDQSLDTGADLSARADASGKVLADFHEQQLALGKEMSIILATGQDLTFHLPGERSAARIATKDIDVGLSGELTQISVEDGRRNFRLALNADLSDVQAKVTELLRAQLDRSGGCGERIAIRQATLNPAPPAGLLTVSLHFERWTCAQMFGQTSASELAESDGEVDIKLIPSVEKSNDLKLSAEFSRIDASGMLAETLRSGDVGEDLRATAAQSVLAAIRAGTDFHKTLPAVLQDIASVQTFKFEDGGAGKLSAVLEGQLQMSNEQTNQLAGQLNQALSAQTSGPR